MKTLPYLVLCLAATGAAPVQDPSKSPSTTPAPDPAAAPDGQEAQEAPEAPDVEPWAGTFAEGMAEVERLARAKEHEEALAVAGALLAPTRFARWRADLEGSTHGWSERALGLLDRPLAWFGLETRTSADRGEIHYAKGLVHAYTGAAKEANEAFELARVLAGPGHTRLDAMYDLGAIDLAAGEVFRAQIPEIAGAAGQPSPAAPPGPGGAAPDMDAPDPLDLARGAYLSAREHFIERLRADWQDADTRADVELVMRRLRELADIERQREQQQQDQDQQNEDQQQPQDGESSDSKDGDQEDQENQQQEGENEDEQEGEQPPDDSESGEDEEGEEAKKPQPEEKVLTQEEVKRLLEELEKLDKEGEELRARLRGVRRQAVDRDW